MLNFIIETKQVTLFQEDIKNIIFHVHVLTFIPYTILNLFQFQRKYATSVQRKTKIIHESYIPPHGFSIGNS